MSYRVILLTRCATNHAVRSLFAVPQKCLQWLGAVNGTAPDLANAMTLSDIVRGEMQEYLLQRLSYLERVIHFESGQASVS
jgi:hypothetical protein